MSYQPSTIMRPCWQAFAVAIIFFITPSVAELSYGRPLLPSFSSGVSDDLGTSGRPVILVSNEAKGQEPDTDIFALMSGRCSILKIAGRDFACRAVAYFHMEQGRTNFTVALDDPTDNSHIVSFSGENGRKQDNLYELPIDRMLLSSKDRPKVDGLPVPFVELSSGICRQLGNFAMRQISSISCTAIDKNGKTYELQFESDGSPIKVRKVRQAPLISEKRRAKQLEQLECRHRADLAQILPRDRASYIIGCLGEDSQNSATDTHP